MKVRAPAFFFALFIMVVVVAFELASKVLLVSKESPPGLGGYYLALLDGILLVTTILFGAGHLRPDGLIARISSVLWLVLSLLGILASVMMAFAALQAIMVMLALLLSTPFGTLAYLALFGDFPAGKAMAALSFLLVLKLAFLVMLAITDLGYLKNKPLMFVTALSIGATWLTSFLIALPPRFLASITDGVAALVISILALLWLVVILLGSVMGVLQGLRFRLGRRQV